MLLSFYMYMPQLMKNGFFVNYFTHIGDPPTVPHGASIGEKRGLLTGETVLYQLWLIQLRNFVTHHQKSKNCPKSRILVARAVHDQQQRRENLLCASQGKDVQSMEIDKNSRIFVLFFIIALLNCIGDLSASAAAAAALEVIPRVQR